MPDNGKIKKESSKINTTSVKLEAVEEEDKDPLLAIFTGAKHTRRESEESDLSTKAFESQQPDFEGMFI